MNNNQKNEEQGSSLTASSILVLLVAMTLGGLAAILVLPKWLPGMAGSLAGPAPKAYWYLSRATALVAMGLLWASMMLGMGITNKMARLWPGAPAAFALHEYFSLLGLGFAAFHALILLGDQYSHYTLTQILIPFASLNFSPFWVGLGQLGFYGWALLVMSFYIRKQIGQRTWRVLHFLSFLTYLGALAHGLANGTDTSQGWVQGFYWFTGGSFLFVFIYRVLNSLFEKIGRLLSSPVQR